MSPRDRGGRARWNSRPRRFQGMPQPGLRRISRPAVQRLAQPAGPVRARRLEMPIFERYRSARFGAGRSTFGAGNGSGGSPDDCTRRQNGVNTRNPRPSLLRTSVGLTSRSPAKLCEATPISSERGSDLIGHGLMRRLCDLVPEHRPGLGLARQPGDDPSPPGPLRSTSEPPIAARLFCKTRSDCASHQRAAPPSGRAFGRLRRARRDRSPARRCWTRHAERDDRKAADRRETRRCREQRISWPSDGQPASRALGPCARPCNFTGSHS